jgi:hypothetical protein
VVAALTPHETRAHFRAARRDSSPVTVLTPHEVRAHFRAAKRDGMVLIAQCDACDERREVRFEILPNRASKTTSLNALALPQRPGLIRFLTRINATPRNLLK